MRSGGVLCGLLVLLGYAVNVGSYWQQINDDAFITFRYSHNLVLGRGPYYNPGEHVEGYTNFSLMLVIAAVIAALGPDGALPAAKGIGVASGAAALVAAWWLGRAWLQRVTGMHAVASPLAWLGVGIAAGSSGFALNSTTGLETTLFSAAVLVGLACTQAAQDASRWRGAGVAFALAALTRPEGVAVFGVTFTARLLTGEWRQPGGRRSLLMDALIVGAVVAAHGVFRYFAYDGELVPNTYYAKAEGLQNDTAAAYVGRFLIRELGIGLWALAPLPLLLGGGRGPEGGAARKIASPSTSAAEAATSATAAAKSPPGLRASVLATVAVVAFSLAAVFKTGADWMLGHRVLVPYLPLWGALIVTGTAVTARLLGRTARGAALVGAFVVLASSVGWQEARWSPEMRAHVATRARGYARGHTALADYLRATTPAGATVALMDIGIVGYRCPDLRILDISGLTDRYIAKSPGPFLEKRYDPAYIFTRAPAVLVIAGQAPIRADGSVDAERIVPLTSIEDRLAAYAGFVQRYARVRAPQTSDPLDTIAATLGAERVFWHDYPNVAYLLIVYRRAA